MRIVGPDEMITAFLAVVNDRAQSLADRWRGPQGAFTREMVGEVLPRVAVLLGLNSYAGDYYTLDSIFFDEKDDVHFPVNLTYAKHISVALEHENALAGTCVEMNKLQLFHAPLKVLITYAREGYGLEQFLEKYRIIIKSADVFEDFATKCRQLVIFGDLVEGRPTWMFFVYDVGGFRRASP